MDDIESYNEAALISTHKKFNQFVKILSSEMQGDGTGPIGSANNEESMIGD